MISTKKRNERTLTKRTLNKCLQNKRTPNKRTLNKRTLNERTLNECTLIDCTLIECTLDWRTPIECTLIQRTALTSDKSSPDFQKTWKISKPSKRVAGLAHIFSKVFILALVQEMESYNV